MEHISNDCFMVFSSNVILSAISKPICTDLVLSWLWIIFTSCSMPGSFLLDHRHLNFLLFLGAAFCCTLLSNCALCSDMQLSYLEAAWFFQYFFKASEGGSREALVLGLPSPHWEDNSLRGLCLLPCVLCGLVVLTNSNVNISQPCGNFRNCSASFLFSFFQPCGFSYHILTGQYLVKDLKRPVWGSPGLCLCVFPSLLVPTPPVLVAMAFRKSDLCLLTSVGLWCSAPLCLGFPALLCSLQTASRQWPGCSQGPRTSCVFLSSEIRVLLCLLSKVCKQWLRIYLLFVF